MTLATPPRHPRRLVFLGTPSAAVPPLQALVAAGFDVALVVTRVDKRRGRGSALSPSPVKEAAVSLGLAVSHRVDDVLAVGADLGVVVAFGQIIKPHVLAEVPMINVHFSLLPRWRGAAPVERALLAGDQRTGVCIMAVEEGLDTGGVHASRAVDITASTTVDSLRAELVAVGTSLLLDCLRDGLAQPVPQQGEVTYADKIDPAELRIDWSRSAAEIDRLVRVGGAWTLARGRRVKVLAARPIEEALSGAPGALVGTCVAAGAGALELLEVQPEGKRPLPAKAWRNGAGLADGDRFE